MIYIICMSEIDTLKAQITLLISQRDLYRMQYNDLKKTYQRDIAAVKRERDAYKKTCIRFAEQIEANKKKNPRGAGRHKYDKKWSDRYFQFSILMDQNKPMNEIMSSLQISRATFFRLKKVYTQDLNFDKPNENDAQQ